MGATLTKMEEAMVKLLQYTLSTRGIKYDEVALRQLLSWAKGKGHFASFNDDFEVTLWEKIGQDLWDEVSKGSKDTTKLSITWRLVSDALKDVKAEREAHSAFVAVGLQPPAKPSLFSGLIIPGPTAIVPLPPWTLAPSPAAAGPPVVPPVVPPAPPDPAVQPKPKGRYRLTESEEGEGGRSDPPQNPPPLDSVKDDAKENPVKPIPSLYPPLPDSSMEAAGGEASIKMKESLGGEERWWQEGLRDRPPSESIQLRRKGESNRRCTESGDQLIKTIKTTKCDTYGLEHLKGLICINTMDS
ncbi:hypothetical protein BTVI_01235 [Pitangus sulphuratus]|nr:hypothetical protein BTVI_01235 [Pitangus sulphuratus]